VPSCRPRGTGKSKITANIAALLGFFAWRVGVIDAESLSPRIHVRLGITRQT
jgi:MinD-like ATPase involved in chromosome partitioning or flagellar assembly